MSQIARMGGGGGAAGVFTLSGDGGVVVNPDGAGNIDINGAGGITVTSNPGTNSLTITNNVIATDFVADDGNTALPALGILNIFSGANISTTAAGNTITIHLDDDVTLPGTFTADIINAITSLNAVGDITTTLGDITAATGNLEVQAGLFHANVDMMAGAEITGNLQLHSLAAGVMQTTAVGLVFSDNGLDGQVLIGGGVAPTWSTLTGTANHITIANAANSITIDTGSYVPVSFETDLNGPAHPVAGTLKLHGLAGGNIQTRTSTLFGQINNILLTLTDDVTIAHDLTVTNAATINGITTCNAALQANGTLTVVGTSLFQAAVAMANNLTVAGNLRINGTTRLVGAVTTDATLSVGTNLAVVGDTVLGTNAGNQTNIHGPVTLVDYGAGVVQSSAAGLLTSTNGANGQVLIGGGANAEWRNLLSADGTVTITNGANSIDLSATQATAGFSGYLGAAVPNATGNNTVYQLKVNTLTLNDGAAYSIATGAYTAPRAGNYFITHLLHVYGMQATHSGLSFDIYVNVPIPIASSAIQTLNCNPWDCSNSVPDVLKFSGSIVLYLNAGDKLTFAVIGNAGPKTIGIGTNTTLSIWPIF